MTWFQRDHTGRLRPSERKFITALSGLLAECAAPQINEDETALSAEGGHCLIALIPHRALGGVSIVVWLFDNRAEVTWAQVAALDCCHVRLISGIRSRSSVSIVPILISAPCSIAFADKSLRLSSSGASAVIAQRCSCATMPTSSARWETSEAAWAGLNCCGTPVPLKKW